MNAMLLTLTAVVLLGADGPAKDVARKPSPFAPSLPELTEEEEKALDKVIDRFIDADVCKLKGEEAKKGAKEFDKLGSESTFALIRGLNRAAKIEGSCPSLVIAKKLTNVFLTTKDPELLEYAKENIGAGVKRSRHADTLRQLRLTCTLRKNKLARLGITQAEPYQSPTTETGPGKGAEKAPRSMTVGELKAEMGSATGARLRKVVDELADRSGDKALDALAKGVTSSYGAEARRAARTALEKSLAKQSTATIKKRLKDRQAEVRAAAAKAAGNKKLRLGSELIELVQDEYDDVRQAARTSLVRLADQKVDFGPAPRAKKEAWAEAAKKWREWWDRQ